MQKPDPRRRNLWIQFAYSVESIASLLNLGQDEHLRRDRNATLRLFELTDLLLSEEQLRGHSQP